VKLMYFDEPTDSAPLRGDLDLRLLLSVNGLAVLVLGILPDGLMAVCLASIRSVLHAVQSRDSSRRREEACENVSYHSVTRR